MRAFSYLLCASMAVALAQTCPAHADAQQPAEGAASAVQVGVLRGTEGDASAFADDLDGALLRDLAGLGGIDNPTVSPIDYAEIKLTVGCEEESRTCLRSIAEMMQVHTLVVRKIHVDEGRGILTLLYFDAESSDEPARAESVVEAAAPGAQLVEAVPTLVRQLFGIPEPVEATAAAPVEQEASSPGDPTPAADESDRGGQVGALTWVTLGAGAAALGAGIFMGASANGSFNDYKNTQIRNAQDVKTANAHFDDAESKGLMANILIPVGAVALGVGATLLVLDLTDDGDSSAAGATEGPRLALHPSWDGAQVTLSGSFGGRL